MSSPNIKAFITGLVAIGIITAELMPHLFVYTDAVKRFNGQMDNLIARIGAGELG